MKAQVKRLNRPTLETNVFTGTSIVAASLKFLEETERSW
jgi:hypothetical protein